MNIVLDIGDKLTVKFKDNDGAFEVHYGSSEHPHDLIIKETDGLPGNKVGVANAILYHENWAHHQSPDDEAADDDHVLLLGRDF